MSMQKNEMIFWCQHPCWQGPIHCFDDGRMERPGIDAGRFVLEQESRLVLNWDRWQPEELLWDGDACLYQTVEKNFTARPFPSPRYARFLGGRHAGPVDPKRLVIGALACSNPKYQNRRRDCERVWLRALESRGVEVLAGLLSPVVCDCREWQSCSHQFLRGL